MAGLTYAAGGWLLSAMTFYNLLTVAAWQLGGRRLALLMCLLCAFIISTGQWSKAMVSVYLVGVSVLIACAIGINSSSGTTRQATPASSRLCAS